MSVAATEQLLLAALDQPATTDGTPESASRSLSELTGTIGGQEQRLSRRIEIAAAIDDLRDRGLVEQRTREDGEAVIELTDTGVEHVETVREELAATTIELVDDEHGRRQLTISEAATAVDRSLVTIAAECSPDGVYHQQTTVEEAGELFVGRQTQLDACEPHLEALKRDRTGQAILFSGPGGIGKTALAAEVLDSARKQGVSVCRARCQGAEAGPYHPLRAAVPTEELPASLAAHADQKGAFDDGLDPEAYEKGRAALFHDITQALVPAADQSPRALFLDDLPLLFVGAYRPTELPVDAPVGPEAATERLPITTMDLGQLEREPTRRLVEAIVGRPGAPDALVGAIHERTGGTPLFVEATVEALLETNQLDPHFQWYPDTSAAIDLPEEVQTTLGEHIETFEVSTREVLTWAALAGEAVPVAVLETVAALEPQRLDTRLAALVEAGVLEWIGDDYRAVAFRNEVVSEALVERLTAEQRQTRHEAIARAFEAFVSDASSGAVEPEGNGEAATSRERSHALVVARQYERGNCPAAAIEWYRRSAEDAQEVFATETAIEAAEAALSLSKEVGDTESLLAVGLQLAEIYVTTAQYEQASRYVQFVRERTPEQDTERRQALAHLAAQIANDRGEYETARTEIDSGLTLGEQPTETRCQLLATAVAIERECGNFESARERITELRTLATEVGAAQFEHRAEKLLGAIAIHQGEHEAAREHLERALSGYEGIEDRHGVAKVHNNLGAVARNLGEFESAREHYRQALAGFEAVDNRHGVAKVHTNLGALAEMRGEHETVREQFQQALAGFEAVEDRRSIAITRQNLGSVARNRGEYETAREHLHQALDTFEALDNRHNLAIVQKELGSTVKNQGEHEAAREYLEQALDGFEAAEDRHRLSIARRDLGTVAESQGEYEKAREYLGQALEGLEAVGDTDQVPHVRAKLGLMAYELGDRDEAEQAFEEAEAMLADVTAGPARARGQFELGQLALALGNPGQAVSLARDARTAFQDSQRPHWVASCRLLLGRAEAATGEHAQAREHCEQALEGFETLSAPQDQLETLELLVELCQKTGDSEQAETYCQQAQSVLETAPAATARGHREWIEGAATISDTTEGGSECS